MECLNDDKLSLDWFRISCSIFHLWDDNIKNVKGNNMFVIVDYERHSMTMVVREEEITAPTRWDDDDDDEDDKNDDDIKRFVRLSWLKETVRQKDEDTESLMLTTSWHRKRERGLQKI